MRRMRLVPERVQKQHIEARELAHRFRGYIAMVGQIRRCPESKPVNDVAAMKQANWLKLEPEKIHRRPIENVRREPGHRRLRFPVIENIAEAALNVGHSISRPVDRNRATLPEIEWPDVIQSHDVVGVSMRE